MAKVILRGGPRRGEFSSALDINCGARRRQLHGDVRSSRAHHSHSTSYRTKRPSSGPRQEKVDDKAQNPQYCG